MDGGGRACAFDEYLRRTRGPCPGTRRNYAGHVGAFLEMVLADGSVEPADIHVSDVVGFVGALTRHYQSGTAPTPDRSQSRAEAIPAR
jgi:hypothetical protein